MTRLISIPGLCSSLVLCALALGGCARGENDSCQLNGDCDDGLICVRARGSERGTCEDPDEIENAEDAGAIPDAAALPPIGEDDAGASDAGAVDTDAG
jgi:hypothetical protein